MEQQIWISGEDEAFQLLELSCARKHSSKEEIGFLAS
jgi:hypothetical protein